MRRFSVYVERSEGDYMKRAEPTGLPVLGGTGKLIHAKGPMEAMKRTWKGDMRNPKVHDGEWRAKGKITPIQTGEADVILADGLPAKLWAEEEIDW